MRRTFSLRVGAVVGACSIALATMGLLFGPTAQASAAIPSMTRSEIISRAESALGLTYTWGKESWAPDARSGSGTDCSGLVLKCWQVPRTMLYQEEDSDGTVISPRYTSYEFYKCLGPWTALSSRTLLKPGDILAYSDGSSGHVVIYAGGDSWNSPIVYEAPGTGQTIRRASRYLSGSYLPRRRGSLVEGGTIILDNSTAKTVGGADLSGNWTRSTAVSGYYGSDFQIAPPANASVWARWTPRFTTAGYYTVYMRWTSGSSRASAAKVTVYTPRGAISRSVNQRSNGGAWNLIGRYYFSAGYSNGAGSVIISAGGADGYVVADAVKFVPN
jgi:hypothetical protein